MNRIPVFEYEILDLLDNANIRQGIESFTLGGASGPGGGIGAPPGGYIGQLAQRYVAYDTDEAESMIVPPGGSSLVHNLNRIRYRIRQLELGGGGGGSGVGWTQGPYPEGAVPFGGPGGSLIHDHVNFYYNNSTDSLYIGGSVPFDDFHTPSRKLYIYGPPDSSMEVNLVAYRNATAFGAPFLVGRRARGSFSAPGDLVSGDYLFYLISYGYGGGFWRLGPFIAFVANDAYTSGSYGARMDFHVVPRGSFIQTRVISMDKATLPGYMLKADDDLNLTSGLSADIEEYVRFMG